MDDRSDYIQDGQGAVIRGQGEQSAAIARRGVEILHIATLRFHFVSTQVEAEDWSPQSIPICEPEKPIPRTPLFSQGAMRRAPEPNPCRALYTSPMKPGEFISKSMPDSGERPEMKK